jgi:hypothetical protein
MEFQRKRSVTLPIFKFGATPLFLRFEGPIYQGERLESQKDMEPPHLAKVVDLTTGEEGLIVVGAVLLSELDRAYPKDAYVGKSFEILKRKAETGKKYSLWSIYEIETEDKPKAK